MYKRYLLPTTAALSPTSLSASLRYASSTLRIHYTEQQKIHEHQEKTDQPLIAYRGEIASFSDKGEEKDDDTGANLPLITLDQNNIGTLAALSNKLLGNILSFSGVSKTARSLCHYKRILCLAPHTGLGIALNHLSDFATCFIVKERSIPDHTHI